MDAVTGKCSGNRAGGGVGHINGGNLNGGLFHLGGSSGQLNVGEEVLAEHAGLEGNFLAVELAKKLQGAVFHDLISVLKILALVGELTSTVEFGVVEVQREDFGIGVRGGDAIVKNGGVVEQNLALTGNVDGKDAKAPKVNSTSSS